ncbi:MAG: hypothetical protein SGBAC_005532 [Bacillariaceae sp.]
MLMNPSRGSVLVSLPPTQISPIMNDWQTSRVDSTSRSSSPDQEGQAQQQQQKQQQQQQQQQKQQRQPQKCSPEPPQNPSQKICSKYSSTADEDYTSSDELSLNLESLVPILQDEPSKESKRKKRYGSTHSSSSIKSLTFDNEVCVFEFNTIIGDNPGVSKGCPIALGQELSNKSIASLRELDYEHSTRRGGNSEAQKLSFGERVKILHGAGFSVREITTATYEALQAKEKRIRTNQKQKWDSFHAWQESVQRKMKKFTTGP